MVRLEILYLVSESILPKHGILTIKESDLYLGLMRVWNKLSAISDKWSWGEVTICALYDMDKTRTASPKSNGSHCWGQHTWSCPRCVHVLLQASLLSFAVNCSPWNNTTSNSILWVPPGGGHSWCTGQSLCHQNSTFKVLYSNQSTNHNTSEYQKLTERTGHQFNYEGNRTGNSNQNAWKQISITDRTNLQDEGTHRASSHDDQDRSYINPWYGNTHRYHVCLQCNSL